MDNPFAGVRAALFDLDGTLIETHIDFDLMRREMARLARGQGVDPTGFENCDVLSVVERAREQITAAQGDDPGRDFRRRAYAILEEIEVAHCAHPMEIPGAAELLRELSRASVAVAIVTRNCRRVSERLVADAGLAHGALLTRDDVERTKPDPSHLLAALDSLGCPGSRAVMVGDHWMDAQGGRAAGLRTVGVLRGRPADFFAPCPPDLLINELADLVPLSRAL